MIMTTRFSAFLLGLLLPIASLAQETASVSKRYKALKCAAPTLGTTWVIHQRDGANRPVEPYLSSLGQGEAGRGMITSPSFKLDTDKITFTICGHDGQAGGMGQNFMALVDARKGKVLLKTPAPGHDALQDRSWDVGRFQGMQVRVEVHDNIGAAAFAWLGVGQIDAGDALKVDFRQGLPEGWQRPELIAETRYESMDDGIPFMRNTSVYTIIPNSGSVEIPCGFEAKRLFFLGCTVAGGKPLGTYGGIEIHYRDASPVVYPLMRGFTLDEEHKQLSPSKAMYLHSTSDPFQHYLVIVTAKRVIEKIRLVAGPDRGPIPRITAITCETSAQSDCLMPLPNVKPSAGEVDWIHTHGLSAAMGKFNEIRQMIRRDHKIGSPKTNVRFEKHTLDRRFLSEGVAVADFNGDGRPDICTGNFYFAGPSWRCVPMVEGAKPFNRYGYSDAFLCFADDINGDRAIDVVVVGFPGQATHWLQNPGRSGGMWKKHLAVERTGNESPHYEDLDGDGRKELVFMDGGHCALANPGDDPTKPWTVRPISNPGDPAPGHGLGIGDINDDGRADIVIPNGWWEGPTKKAQSPWRFHPGEIYGGVQMCVSDFDGDGDNDVLGASAHGYGIAWTEQTPDGWKIHEINSADSQTHAVHLADLNGDGRLDFVTGKRFWAHNGHDPGSFQPSLLCWYEKRTNGADGKPRWTKHEIDATSGVGLHFEIVDLDGDGLLDIVTSNKNGVYWFEQVQE